MATKNQNLSSYDPESVPFAGGLKIAITVARWNSNITYALLDGAISTLKEHGVESQDIDVFYVPGTFELVHSSASLVRMEKYDAVIAIGCVIQGETPHFTFISDAVANGLASLNMNSSVPVIFGVLTTDNMEQAEERAGGKHGNKGVEAGITAIQMAKLFG
ncbi:6,7-dimethyl-8-ribityllumazine synthase [Porphyromonas sp. COT-108 OH1349]|uniref:6,7-dimethyl-8-ribityllumazine synthase n=1 Tax=Porphyromonas sp. COT-108 OH1349 TaxID=1537504 RepID=UPI00052D9159|nr:6,7-dimethyl-8-ribityllumazine synthase [Porphyromonas sp. COT-108 OH1349]KGN70581.1 6,7-dimethyl-8-ribityllumazine synthase [Porphyromonas sp. COT-108 OH1349]